MKHAPTPIRSVIVDDEPLARDRLQRMLMAEDAISVVAAVASGSEAITVIMKHEPDLVFLDVQLPELDGFGVLAATRPPQRFAVIFVTAHDEYALPAFDVPAIDYLLKPFDAEHLHRAVRRAREHLASRGARGVAPDGSSSLPPAWDRLAVRENNRVVFLKPADIDWIQADGNYVHLHVGAHAHLLRETLHAVEHRLAPRGFLRVNRSALVNLDRVRELQPLFHGDAVIVLHDGQRLNVTRAFRAQFDEVLALTR